MKQSNKRSNRLPKRKSVTINDLLARDDVNGIIENLNEVKPNITAALVIYLDKDNICHYQGTEDTLESTLVWMLETTKLNLIDRDID